MELAEKYARTICTMRGSDPDEPLSYGKGDGTSATVDQGWKAYIDLSEALLALHEEEAD